MVRALQGYFKGGKFISSEQAEIPEEVEVYVMITDREVNRSDAKAQRQLAALDKFVDAISSSAAEPLSDNDFLELENNRVDFNRAVSL